MENALENTKKEKPKWLNSLEKRIENQKRMADLEFKSNPNEHSGQSLHSESFSRVEIIEEAKTILEKLILESENLTHEILINSIKSKIPKSVISHSTENLETDEPPITPKEIEHAAYEFLLEQLE